MKKKLVALLLSFSCLCSLAPIAACDDEDNTSTPNVENSISVDSSSEAASEEGTPSENESGSTPTESTPTETPEEIVGTQGLEFSSHYNSNFTEIIGYEVEGIGEATDKDIVIPSHHEGVPVTAIGYGAFEDSDVTSVSFGDNITEIGFSAFKNCTKLTKVVMGNNVTKMEFSAFSGCSALQEITLSKKLTSISEFAFSGCTSLTDIVIPDSVKTIYNYAFFGCESLYNITMGNGIEKIGEEIFKNCGAFHYTTYENGNYIGNEQNPYVMLVSAVDTNVSSITIHENARVIAEYALCDCTKLKDITIPKNIKAIGYYAFYNCQFTNVRIEDLAAWCNINFVSSYSNPLEFTFNAYANSSSLVELTIPASAKEIKPYAFQGFAYIEKLTIEEGVTSIGAYAFTYSYDLKEISLPNSLTHVGEGNFDGFFAKTEANDGYYLGNVQNPHLVLLAATSQAQRFATHEKTQVIAGGAFVNSPSIESVTIAKNVVSIGENAFTDCYSLSSVTFANSSGWRTDGEKFSSSELSDTETAAQYLKSLFSSTCWTRE